ncbi:MAG: 3-hydroxyacyl-CoA dehydrogenase/enoyl-CoA hydratase family protein [Sphingobacteriaceae bacterium]|nr:3-hydroxyacyl-CoA dehydrogenase/enoyl-CoA hydratase family protein [Sphingobacteriaceae bacterium]
MRNIKIVGVIGAGTMGAAIAQKFAQEGYTVYLNDREQKFVDKGINGIRNVLEQGIERKLFTREQVDNVLTKIIGSIKQVDLVKCDLIVEAIFEDFKIKSELFKALDKIVPKETILATNTSSFSVTELAKSVSNPARFIGLHYFYHAAKNRLVEIIPGAQTSEETYKSVQNFSIQSGKDAITTKDVYGFAVNRFFVPWLNEACKLLNEGMGSIFEIDNVCMKIFGIGMGPFALMNATGVPIAMHAQKTLEHFGPSYKVSEKLEQQVSSGQNWDLSDVENSKVTSEKEMLISERMLGCTFFVCSQILEEKVCSAVDLNRGAKIGLRWRFGPIDLMSKYGVPEVERMVNRYCDLYKEEIPKGIKASNWKMEFITLTIHNTIACITMSRPEDLNALNEEVVQQLDSKFTEAESNPNVKTIILTGSGKAFVAGADIKFFVKNIKQQSIEKIVNFTKYGQGVFRKIDQSRKKVVTILNGLALGGGMELALCADVLLAVDKTKIAFPETGIGIYPGLGGTQRTTQRIGKGLAKYLVLSGQMISAKQAYEIGLIDGIIKMEDISAYVSGEREIPPRVNQKLSDKWLAIAKLYSDNNYKDILLGNYSNGGLQKEEIESLIKAMKFKAPIAMKFADELIEEANGPESELTKLVDIFSTKDALLGLSSIGKKVEYTGE